jgi:AbiV family abortive infection protein
MAAARRNATRLAQDAELLLSQGRWASASSLAILSIEESGKIGVLRRLSVVPDARAMSKAWQGYRSHHHKLGVPIGVDLAGVSLTDPAAIAQAIEDTAKVVKNMDVRKQAGFYTDCVPGAGGQPLWSEPERMISEEHAREVVYCANLLLTKREVSLREIELFIEHVGPVVGTPKIIDGWRKWSVAMDSEGLLTETLEEHENRVLGSIFG